MIQNRPSATQSHTDEPDLGPIDSNQTSFTWEEPIFESVAQTTDPSAKVQVVPKTPWFRQPILLMAIAGAAIVITLVALMALLRTPVQLVPQASPSPSPINVTVSDPLRQEIQELQLELRDADPSKQDLPYPPVNMELQITLPK